MRRGGANFIKVHNLLKRDVYFAIAASPLYTLTSICLVEYIKHHGICVRNHCGAEPPRDNEPAGLVTTVCWRDRTPTSCAAADRVKASASAARGRFRGI